jgi:hypothetical protein
MCKQASSGEQSTNKDGLDLKMLPGRDHTLADALICISVSPAEAVGRPYLTSGCKF